MEQYLVLENMVYLWFIIGVLLLLSELFLPSFILIFWGFGAIFTGIVGTIYDFSLNIQIIIFIVSSILFLIFLRKYLKQLFTGFQSQQSEGESDFDEFTNKKAVVIEKISPLSRGRVSFKGTSWDAESEEEIEVDKTVLIIGKESICLKVKQI